MKNNRIAFIDIARGIGIILVLYGHGLNADSYRHLIYSFHMPLFFFLSGMVFHSKKADPFFPFFKKSVLSILVPYIFFALISYLTWWINRIDAVSFYDFLGHMYGILYANGNNGYLFFNVVLWFLPCLFITRVAFAGLTRALLSTPRLIATLLGISILGYTISILYPDLILPFGIETALTALVFYGGGSIVSLHHKQLPAFLKKNPLILFFLIISATIVLATVNFNMYGYQIDMRLNRLSNYFLFYISAFGGITACIYLSIGIQKNKILEYIGQNSLPLFALHMIIFTYLSRFTGHILPQNIIHEFRNTLLAPIFTIITIILILLGVLVYNRIKGIVMHTR